MKVRKLEKSDRGKYKQLAKEHGTIFNTLEWLDLFGDQIELFGIFDKKDRLIGGFDLYKQRKFGLTVYKNPPFTPFIGPFLKVRSEKRVYRMKTWKKALRAMADSIEELPYAVISFSLAKNVIDTQPFYWNGFKVTAQYTYQIDLQQSLKTIENEMTSKKRNEKKTAEQEGVKTEQILNFDIVRHLVEESLDKAHVNYDTKSLNSILNRFSTSPNCFAFGTIEEGKPTSASLYVNDQYTAYRLLNGYDHNLAHRGAGVLETWRAIQFAKGQNLRYFDFEGSMVPGIEHYLREFGGLLTPYYRINKAKLPLEILLKFTRRTQF